MRGKEPEPKHFSAGAVEPVSSDPEPGWYLDPDVYELERWWDGDAWSEHTRPGPRWTYARPPTDPVGAFVLWIIGGGVLIGIAAAAGADVRLVFLMLAVASVAASVSAVAWGVSWGIDRAGWVKEQRDRRNAQR